MIFTYCRKDDMQGLSGIHNTVYCSIVLNVDGHLKKQESYRKVCTVVMSLVSPFVPWIHNSY